MEIRISKSGYWQGVGIIFFTNTDGGGVGLSNQLGWTFSRTKQKVLSGTNFCLI